MLQALITVLMLEAIHYLGTLRRGSLLQDHVLELIIKPRFMDRTRKVQACGHCREPFSGIQSSTYLANPFLRLRQSDESTDLVQSNFLGPSRCSGPKAEFWSNRFFV